MDLSLIIWGIMFALLLLVPLAIKWQLDKKVTLPAIVAIGFASGAISGELITGESISFGLVGVQVLLVVTMTSALLAWRFYRDPERFPPQTEGVILSPADGEIIYVKRILKGEVPVSEKKGKTFPLSEFTQSDLFTSGGYVVGIAMSFLDVHVNRAPLDGRVCLQKKINGLFLSLKKKEAILQNERALIVIENGEYRIGIVQIASRLVRNIVNYIDHGQVVKMGQRIGMIRFGSQVDVILPDHPSLEVNVSPGQKVKAGLSILADMQGRSGAISKV